MAETGSWLERAERCLVEGDLVRAQQLCGRALSSNQNVAEALRLLALISRRAHNLDEAIALARRAAAADETNAACACTLGELLTVAGRAAQAILVLQSTVEHHPAVAQAQQLLGDAYAAANCPAAAEDAYRAALALWPDYPEAHAGLGRLHAHEGRPDEAVAALETALRLQPGNAGAQAALGEILRNRAQALLSGGQLSQALKLTQRASVLAPNDADAHYVLGNVLLRMQRPQESLTSYRRALNLSPTPKARFALASPLLMLGQFQPGWDAYEARLGMAGVPWKICNPLDRLWDGREIGGRKLLVHTEQGLGDTLQFIRYLPLVRGRAGPDARIELLCEPPLARLLATVEGYDALHAPRQLAGMEYDVQVPLLSLPQRFGTTLDSIPGSVPYLRLPADARRALERPAGAKLVVAFAWAGRPTHADDQMRSCGIGRFASLFDLEGVHFRAIQVGERAADIKPWLARPNVSSMTEGLTDFADTLAVMDQADLVIAVDTSVVHLAGAAGKPVWTLLAYGGEWRWLMEREDSPWYPTMRLFRQRAPGDWDEVFARIRARLEGTVNRER